MSYEVDDRTLLMGLTVECPLGGNPEDCQWHFLRELPQSARVAYSKALTVHEGAEVLDRHRACLAEKEELLCTQVKKRVAAA